MTGRHLETTVRFQPPVGSQPPVAILDLQGEINGFAEESLMQGINQALGHHPSAILLNFIGVDYINSTGIALIVGLMAQARNAGALLLACGLSEHYVEIFQITRLSDFMQLFPDETSALDSVKQKV
jgi:anti-anti-sigma factor